jgi:hypothetical protein
MQNEYTIDSNYIYSNYIKVFMKKNFKNHEFRFRKLNVNKDYK